ncbi:MAG: toprim domain-containing protein [Candidatus Paceibacterota bacterium]|jgi:recombination protein RecR
MNAIDKLVEKFRNFPGIGPRQARRFAYFLLSQPPTALKELASLIAELRGNIIACQKCQRYFEKERAGNPICNICRDKNREAETLMIVARDIDLESIEKANSYHGNYFILGGNLPILEPEPEKKIRLQLLLNRVGSEPAIKEIILAMNLNPDGEHTGDFVEAELRRNFADRDIKISHLGRGLSTGAELEYADRETIKSALKNRF